MGKNQGTAGTAWHWNQAGECSNPSRTMFELWDPMFLHPLIRDFLLESKCYHTNLAELSCGSANVCKHLAQQPRTSPRAVSQEGQGQEKGQRNGGELTAQGASSGLRIARTLSHKDMVGVEELRGNQLPGSILFVEFVTHNQAVTIQCGHSERHV